MQDKVNVSPRSKMQQWGSVNTHQRVRVVALRHRWSLGVCWRLTKGTMELARFSTLWQLAPSKWCNNQLLTILQQHTICTLARTYAPPPPSQLALPVPTGTNNIVLSYKKDFSPSIHCSNYWINADGERHLHVKVLASRAQQMFPCHLLKLCRLDTRGGGGGEGGTDDDTESYSANKFL